MKQFRQWFLVFLTLMIILTACTTPAPVTKIRPTPATPASGKAVITGEIKDAFSHWSDTPLMAFAAPVYKNESGKGFYMLDASLHPQAELDASGYFQIVDAPPGEYVIVVGPTADDVRVVMDNKKPRIFEVKADQVLDVATLSID